MELKELEPLKAKTTMRIGGQARFYTELKTKGDAEEAFKFAKEKHIPLIPIGNGANTIFADGIIDALVLRIDAKDVDVDGNTVKVQAGKNLAMLINELANQNLDLSALTGIPGTIGGSIFGNAGQGPKGIWMDHFVEAVEAYVDGAWKIFSRDECNFHYRESVFKNMKEPVIIWSAVFTIPSRPKEEIQQEVQSLLQKRIETQPHLKTAGSCFTATSEGIPAWKLIDAAGLRGHKVGGVEISEKHANFLLNTNSGSYEDVLSIVKTVQENVPTIASIEMRLYNEKGMIDTFI